MIANVMEQALAVQTNCVQVHQDLNIIGNLFARPILIYLTKMLTYTSVSIFVAVMEKEPVVNLDGVKEISVQKTGHFGPKKSA